MEAFLSGFSVVLQFQYLAYMFAGVSLGLLFGFLPGLTGAMAIALMLPFSFGMPPLTALVFMLSIYTGGLFGGAVTAILIKTPGAPSNIMTTLDGYPMHRKGQSERALGLALMSSVIGGIVGCLFLLVLCKPLAAIALKFSSAEMFMVMIFGLSVVGSLSNNPFKAIFFRAVRRSFGNRGRQCFRGPAGHVKQYVSVRRSSSYSRLNRLGRAARGIRPSRQSRYNGQTNRPSDPASRQLPEAPGRLRGDLPASFASPGLFCHRCHRRYHARGRSLHRWSHHLQPVKAMVKKARTVRHRYTGGHCIL